MRTTFPNTPNIPASRVTRFAAALLVAGLVTLLLPACKHDVLMPGEPDPDPTDTMPDDTLGMPCDPGTVYFSKDILPLLKSNCAKSGCHDAETAEEGIILDSYQNVLASDIIRAGRPEDSEMIEKMKETDPDDAMPPPPNERMTAEQIALIEAWILQGAKDLTCDDTPATCDTVNVSYAMDVVPILQPNCIGCHSGGNPGGNVRLNTFAGVREVALNGRLAGAISWANGFQRMPKNGDQLPACDIALIKAWINDGAPEN
jgi:mono/diheme cytochrome c family protein